MAASYDGTILFGYSVKMRHSLNPTAEQVNAFFGVQGTQSLFGGLRGRVFEVEGVLFGTDISTLNAAEAAILSYVDGIARVLVDTRGRSFPAVLMKAFQPVDRVKQDARGFYQEYKAALLGLI